MKLFRLFLFLIFSSCTITLVAQSCSIEDLSLRLNPCSGNEFSINYDFTYLNPTSSQYRLFVDGEEIGVFPYHQRNIPVVLDGTQARNIVVRVEDSTNSSCSVEDSFNFLGCDAGSCELTIESVDVSNSSCIGDGTFDLVFSFSTDLTPESLLNVYANGEFIEQISAVDTSPVDILGFIKSNNLEGTELLTISAVNNPACYSEFTFETIDCTDCNIFNIEVSVEDCSNGEFYATINFDYINPGSSFVLGGNNETYGNFSYDQLPVTIGPLQASPNIDYEFLIIDLNASNCFNFYTLGVVVCNDEQCLITNLTANNMTCNGESAYDIEINFNASGTPSGEFEISFNGNVIETITENDLPYLISNIEATTPGSDVVSICAVGDPDCCENISIQRPNCSCEISNIQVVNVECEDNDIEYSVELNITNSLGAGTEFDVYINGAIFTTLTNVQGSIELRNISLTGNDTDEITICSTLDASCCISVDVTQPNCDFVCPIVSVEVVAGECEELLFPATVNIEYTGAASDFLIIEVNGTSVGSFPAASFPGTVSGLMGDGVTSYNVEVFTADRSCSESFELEPVLCSTSVNEGTLNGSVSSRIYNGELILDYTIEGFENTECTLIDMSGRILWSQKNVEFSGQGNHRFTVNGLSNGVYILRLHNENFVYVNKILAR